MKRRKLSGMVLLDGYSKGVGGRRMSAVIGRREFMAVVGAAIAWRPISALAQPRPMAVIAYCSGQQKKFAAVIAKWLKDVGKGLAELGYVEGKNY